MTTDQYFLSHGAHRTAADGRCAMEFVAYLAGEPHSDKPMCVSPLLRDFCIAFNDALPDDERQRLRPYLARMIGTAGDGRDGERAWLCADWLVRVHVPAWLDLTGLTVLAARLRALPEVASPRALRRAEPVLTEARWEAAPAWVAGWTTVGDTARSVARMAVGDTSGAARVAAGHVAGVAWTPPGDTARIAAAGVAARAAAETPAWMAGDAAWVALRPTVVGLQRSTFDLLDRMLPTEPLALPAADTVNRKLAPVGAS